MPALGMAQDTGTLIRWLIAEGQQVSKGDPLMEVETDKATVEVEAPASGTLAGVIAKDGDVIPVAQVIAVILAPGETKSQIISPSHPDASKQLNHPARSQDVAASPLALRVAEDHQVDLRQVKAGNGGKITKADVLAYVETQKESPAGTGGRLAPASPKARRLAAERGIALRTVTGTGPNGAVLASDVMAAQLPAVTAEPAHGQMVEISKAWRVMAERLSAGWPSVPHFYLVREVDVTRLMVWREQAQRKSQQKFTYTDLLVKVAAAALKQHPRVNSSWNGQGIVRNSEVNVGLAVAVEDGLIVPVIHNADALAITSIAERRHEIVERATTGKLRLDDLQGGTFTISNLGMYGVDAFNAIVNPPESAILAVGRIADRVVPVDGQPAVRPMMVLTLSCDHRVIDGARGAQFLDAMASLIEEPMGLID